jgi:low affinity Fe/Cu permease
MSRLLFGLADFLSRPPGFFVVLGAMVVCVGLVPAGFTDLVTFALSVAAVVITCVVLIQGYRDTSAIHAKLDEIIVALRETRNDVVGLEHAEPHEIRAVVERLEREAEAHAGASATERRAADDRDDKSSNAAAQDRSSQRSEDLSSQPISN